MSSGLALHAECTDVWCEALAMEVALSVQMSSSDKAKSVRLHTLPDVLVLSSIDVSKVT